MIKRIILAFLIAGLFICSFMAGKDYQQETTQELKKQDEAIFKTYRDGLGLAADTLGCYGNVPCIEDKTAQIDDLIVNIEDQLTKRQELVGAENE